MTNTLPGGLRHREALAVRRDELAATLMAALAAPLDPVASLRWEGMYRDYQDLGRQIAATGEVVMGPGEWRRATVRQEKVRV